MNVRRGEVVLVDFPYSDHTGSKVRPALEVQADALNRRLDDTILALIISSRHRRVGGATTQYAIDITTPEGQQTGLRLNSVIPCENLLTYDQALILRVLGRLSATAMEQIDVCLKAALGIP
jgi:mRNA interferase MazF